MIKYKTMTKTRQTKKLLAGVTREAAEEAFASYAKADAKIQKISATMDIEFSKIREKFQAELAELNNEKDKTFEVIQKYAEDNRHDFGQKKSMEMAHGIIGFRTGTPKLKTRKGFTWSSVTNLLKEFLPDYIRTTEEPAKDRLLADRESPDVNILFDKVGIFVDQDENFFIECKKELVEA